MTSLEKNVNDDSVRASTEIRQTKQIDEEQHTQTVQFSSNFAILGYSQALEEILKCVEIYKTRRIKGSEYLSGEVNVTRRVDEIDEKLTSL